MTEPRFRLDENEPFIVRLSDNQLRAYAAGSTIEIGAKGDVIATDPAGTEWRLPREHWLDISIGTDRAITNRWYAQRHVR